MQITLSHTEPLEFERYEERLFAKDIAPYYAVLIEDEEVPRIFRADEDPDYLNCLCLFDDENADILDKDSSDLIKAWEPLWTGEIEIQYVN